MAGRLAREHAVVVFDTHADALARAVGHGATPATGLTDLVSHLTPPRTVWIMLPAGSPTEDCISELSSALENGDVIVDGGNSHYRSSIRRAATLADGGIQLLDVGTSGGVKGGELGYALMVGGSDSAVERLRPIFEALAFDAQRGWGHVGSSGAGHFAKMVHNGIEYGMIQAYAQGLFALSNKRDHGFDLAKVTDIWCHGGMVRSALLEVIRQALAESPELGPLAPYVADEGAGRWTVEDALDQLAQRGFGRDQFA